MAEKGFGIKELNLIGASGTPTIESPNNLNLNAINVAISTNVSIGGTLTVSGNISAGGTITYEDVTNVDSIGIITARSGLKVTGGELVVGNNTIKLGNAGVITATSFIGALTGNVTGTASSATRADLAFGLIGTPSIVVGVATLGSHKLNEAGANIAGILTAASFSVGANEVVSSARQLKNIATLDATTKLTIENAISDPPNDFDDLNVVGLGTINTLFVGAHTKGLNIIGVTTGLAVPGISTLGIVTGATSLQATDVYTNFLHGNGANITGISTLNITNYGVGLGGGGSAGVTVQDEGSALSTTATTLNFVGASVVASGSGATKTITVSAGAGDTTDIRTNTLVVGEYSSGISTFAGAIDVNNGANITGGRHSKSNQFNWCFYIYW